MSRRISRIASFLCAVGAAGVTQAQTVSSTGRVSQNTYGVPGLIDMPSARVQPDGELITSLLILTNETARAQVSFQMTPRFQAVFRYATIPDFLVVDGDLERTFDRGFDLRYQLFREGRYRPAVTIGLQDFGGTSIYSAEYLVASKAFFDGRLDVSAGIGWGRFGTEGGFTNPLGIFGDSLETRPGIDLGEGGTPEFDRLFRGDAAFFGGLAWKISDRWVFKAEYSSDAYEREEAQGIFDQEIPFNFGLEWTPREGVTLGAYAINGAEVGFNLQFALNPKRSPNGSGLDSAPQPVALRPPPAQNPDFWSTAWTQNPAAQNAFRDVLSANLQAAGLELVASKLTADSAEIRFRNLRYRSQAQAVGRAARAATASLPGTIETFILVPLNADSQTGTAVVLRRSDIEALENAPNGAGEIEALAGFTDAVGLGREGLEYQEDAFPRFSYRLGPFTQYGLFDPDAPIRADFGVELSARYEPLPGFILSGAVRQRIAGNRDEVDRENDSELPPVRTDTFIFAEENSPVVERLTADYLFRPGRNLYARISAGLLERQFGGISGELLWKPTGSRLALGAEVNRVVQRDFNGGFGFQTLDATTYFASAYFDHRNGFVSQLDVGQYLAGDQGATYTLTREFNNGWKIGGYVTLTDVTDEEFGEGSFDRGILLTIPLDWALGQPTRATGSAVIQPILRDGGARLRLANRLYPAVRDLSPPDLTDEWGRFWR